MPKKAVFGKKGAAKKARGDLAINTTTVETNNGLRQTVWFTSWMDNKPVHMVSTFKTFIGEVRRVTKSATNTFLGYAMIVIPTIIMIYNKTMGGTDSFDQKLVYYKTRVRCKRWPIGIFTQFLQCAVVNGAIVYRDDKKLLTSQNGYTLRTYLDLLIDQLATTQLRRPGRTTVTHHAEAEEDETKAKRFFGKHSIFFVRRSRTSEGPTRWRCKMCKSLTQSGCKTCEVALCIESDPNDPEDCCFNKYHDKDYVCN